MFFIYIVVDASFLYFGVYEVVLCNASWFSRLNSPGGCAGNSLPEFCSAPEGKFLKNVAQLAGEGIIISWEKKSERLGGWPKLEEKVFRLSQDVASLRFF